MLHAFQYYSVKHTLWVDEYTTQVYNVFVIVTL